MKNYINKDFCGIIISLGNDNILEFNQYMKSEQVPYIVYADIECLSKKIDECTNNPENCSITKLWEHILRGYTMPAIEAYDHIENKHRL